MSRIIIIIGDEIPLDLKSAAESPGPDDTDEKIPEPEEEDCMVSFRRRCLGSILAHAGEAFMELGETIAETMAEINKITIKKKYSAGFPPFRKKLRSHHQHRPPAHLHRRSLACNRHTQS